MGIEPIASCCCSKCHAPAVGQSISFYSFRARPPHGQLFLFLFYSKSSADVPHPNTLISPAALRLLCFVSAPAGSPYVEVSADTASRPPRAAGSACPRGAGRSTPRAELGVTLPSTASPHHGLQALPAPLLVRSPQLPTCHFLFPSVHWHELSPSCPRSQAGCFVQLAASSRQAHRQGRVFLLLGAGGSRAVMCCTCWGLPPRSSGGLPLVPLPPLHTSASTARQGSKPLTLQRLLPAPVPLSIHFPSTFQGCVNHC